MQINVRSTQDPKRNKTLGSPAREERPKRESRFKLHTKDKSEKAPVAEEQAVSPAVNEPISDPEPAPELDAIAQEEEASKVEELNEALNSATFGFVISLVCSIVIMFVLGFFIGPIVLRSLGVLA